MANTKNDDLDDEQLDSIDARMSRLERDPIFALLDDAARRRVAKSATVRTLKKRERLIHREQRLYDVFFVWTGAIDMVRRRGDTVSFGGVDENESFGYINALGSVRHGVDYEAVRPSVVLSVPAELIRDLVIAYPPMLFAIVALIGQRVRVLRQEIVMLNSGDPTARLLHALKRLEDKGPKGAGVEVTHAVLATHVGARRETVSRALRKLVKEGRVTCSRGKIWLKDR